MHKLSTINFENVSDPNTMHGMNEWKTAFVGTADDHAPFRIRRVTSTYSPWPTDDIKKEIYHRDYKKKSIQTGSIHYQYIILTTLTAAHWFG